MTIREPSRSTRRTMVKTVVLAGAGLMVEACAGVDRAPPKLPLWQPLAGGLDIRGTRFFRDGRPLLLSGFNHWAAGALAREGNDRGWDQVRRDLDQLQGLGVNSIRVMAAMEGPDSEPWRVVPSIQPSPGHYDLAGVAGLLRLADEARRRRLVVIFTLNDFWPWSGGMAQYVAWAVGSPIPYPPPQPGGSFSAFSAFAARFYVTERAKAMFRDYVRFLVPQLNANPAVIWELANEPRGMMNVGAYRSWIDATARLIKSLAPGQLVTTGSEGETSSPAEAGLDVVEDHRSPAVDFVTCHLWAQNWGWVDAACGTKEFERALQLARDYVERHAAMAARLAKPILLEEFGFPRDAGSFDPAAPTTFRDRYFEAMYALVASLALETPMLGIFPWAWSGSSRPRRPGGAWRPGDPLTGDPPHEPQGWYGIYESDSTIEVIRDGCAALGLRA